jgi:hypothetical protein
MPGQARTIAAIPVILLGTAACAQSAQLLPGTALTVLPGTTVQVNGALGFGVGANATCINHGTIELAPQAFVQEAPGSPITGDGTERITRTFSAPLNAADVGGLGLVVTTGIAPGTVTVQRGHLPRTGQGGNTSVARWYDWDATTNTGLGATVRFGYDAVLLNGIPETDQVLHVQQSSADWVALPSAVNTVDRVVEATGMDSIGTLTTFAGALSTGLAARLRDQGALLVPTLADDEVRLLALAGTTDRPVRVVDVAGRPVWSGILPASMESVRIPVHALASGAYTVQLDEGPGLRFVRP